MTAFHPLLVAALLFGSASAALAEDLRLVNTVSFEGQVYLANAEKMSLYTFDKDSAGTSACYEKCAMNWPPLVAEDVAGLGEKYTLVARTDGTRQVAYDGKPLYLWVKDAKPGDTSGDGVNGVWHLARP